jgi:hypothetical protein
MQKSKFLRLNGHDLFKGFITAIGMSILTAIHTSIAANPPKFPTDLNDWKHILYIGLGAGITYLIKNLFTNSKDEFLKTEN